VTGKGGKGLGMGVWYISDARNFEELKSGAQDLFEYINAVAEQQHDRTIIVMARFGSDPNAMLSTSTDFGIVYERDSSGTWRQDKVDERAFPRVPAASIQAARPDSRAEVLAKADADAWLALFDAGSFEESWSAASPYFKKVVSRTDWMKSANSIRSRLGKLVSRTQISTTATSAVPNAPPGKYVSFAFRAVYSNRSLAVEDVLEMLCDDGKWRVAGYAVR
jgi:hypothetical protein